MEPFLLPDGSPAAAEDGDLSLVGVADRRFFNMVLRHFPSHSNYHFT